MPGRDPGNNLNLRHGRNSSLGHQVARQWTAGPLKPAAGSVSHPVSLKVRPLLSPVRLPLLLSPVRLLHPVKVQGPQQRLVCPLNAPKSSGSTSSPIFYVNLYILYVYVYILCIFHVTEPRNRSTTLAASSYCFWEVRPSIRPATVLSFQRRFGFRDLSLQDQGPSPASPEIKVNSL